MTVLDCNPFAPGELFDWMWGAGARTQLAHHTGHTQAEREALQASVTRRTTRATDLTPFPCQTLR